MRIRIQTHHFGMHHTPIADFYYKKGKRKIERIPFKVWASIE